jgi:ATP-dependent Lon protease
MRRRVKEQLKKMGGIEYWNTALSYVDIGSGVERIVEVPEQAAIEPAKPPAEPQIGRVMGLAITQSYGTVQHFEIIASEGSGRLIPLGSMRSVMRESLRAAYEFIARNHKSLDIEVNIKKDFDVSVLATQMGVPKEGPSAGITILTGLVSAFVKKPVKNDVAMTGEITLMGKVLAVGGIQEKILAASEAGIKKVYVPAANSREVDLLPKQIRKSIEVQLVSSVDEVLNDAIIGYHVRETISA